VSSHYSFHGAVQHHVLDSGVERDADRQWRGAPAPPRNGIAYGWFTNDEWSKDKREDGGPGNMQLTRGLGNGAHVAS
jgi:hypothetical protein